MPDRSRVMRGDVEEGRRRALVPKTSSLVPISSEFLLYRFN